MFFPGSLALALSMAGSVALWGRCVREVLAPGRIILHTMHLVCEHAASCPAQDLGLGFNTVCPLVVHGFNANVTGRSGGDAFVVVATSSVTLVDFLKRQPRAEAPSHFLLSWPGAGDDTAAKSDVLAACWAIGLVATVVVDLHLTVAGTAEIFSYFPVAEGRPCFDTSPTCVATWSAASGLSGPQGQLGPQEVFPRVRNLQGCPMHVIVHPAPPFLVVEAVFEAIPAASAEGKGGVSLRLRLGGEWRPFVTSLERGLNATFQFHSLEKLWRPSDNWDMAIAWLSSSLKLYSIAQFTDTYRSVCYSICVPHYENWQPPWRSLVSAFGTEVRSLYLVSLLAASLVMHLAAGRTNSFTYTLLDMILKVPRLKRRTIRKLQGARILVAHWLVFDLVMSNAYLAAEKSVRAAPPNSQGIRNMQDLVLAGVPLYGPTANIRAVEELLVTLEGGPRYLAENRTHRFGLSSLSSVKLRADVAYLCSPTDRQILNDARRRDPKLRHDLVDKCVVNQPERLTIVRKGSPYGRLVSRVTARLAESGLLIRYLDGAAAPQPQASGSQALGPSPLTALDVRHALFLLQAGLAFSASVFLLEVAASRAHAALKRLPVLRSVA